MPIDFFCDPGLKNCWHGLLGIEPTTLYLSSQSGAFDLSAMATPYGIQNDYKLDLEITPFSICCLEVYLTFVDGAGQQGICSI